MKSLKLKTVLGRWLASLTLLRTLASSYLQVQTRLMRNKRHFVAVLSGDETHAYSSAKGVRALGKKVLLVTGAPKLQELAYADAILLIDPVQEPEKVMTELASFQLDGVLVSNDTHLLSLQHKIAKKFDLISVGEDAGILGTDKFAWREELNKNNVPQPFYSADPADFEEKACIRKPRLGLSSQGVKALGIEDDKVPYAGPEFYFEAALPGDQYNFEGVVRDGEVNIFVRMFDKYREINGTLVPRYYFMNPPLTKERQQALDHCTKETLAGSNIVNGAFHLEMRMDGDRPLPIDFANRIGASERATSFSIGCSLGEAHASCFVEGSNLPKTNAPKSTVQFWCWTEEEYNCANEILEKYPEWVFDSKMSGHKMNGETCFGTFTLYHDDRSKLIAMTKSLDLQIVE